MHFFKIWILHCENIFKAQTQQYLFTGTTATFRGYGFMCALVLAGFVFINFYRKETGFVSELPATEDPHQVNTRSQQTHSISPSFETYILLLKRILYTLKLPTWLVSCVFNITHWYLDKWLQVTM
jgi:hypothetical protein